MAALGSDVVPLVKSRTAISSGSTKGCSPVTGSAMAAANSALVRTLVAPMSLRRSTSCVVGDHDAAGDAAENAAQLLVGGAVVERSERDAGQRGTEEGHRQRVLVQPEVADDLGAALLEVDGSPPGSLEEIRGGDPPVMRTKNNAVGVALGCHFEQHGDVHDGVPFFPVGQSEAGRGLAPLTVRMVSPTEMAPSPALVQRSSRPSSSSL